MIEEVIALLSIKLFPGPAEPKGPLSSQNLPDSKVHGANMGPIWGRQDPGGPHVGPMNFAIWAVPRLPFWCDSPHAPKMLLSKYPLQILCEPRCRLFTKQKRIYRSHIARYPILIV